MIICYTSASLIKRQDASNSFLARLTCALKVVVKRYILNSCLCDTMDKFKVMEQPILVLMTVLFVFNLIFNEHVILYVVQFPVHNIHPPLVNDTFISSK